MAEREGLPLAMPVCAARFFVDFATSEGRVQTLGPVGRALVPLLKRHHPNPDELDWGDGGARGIRTLGEVTPTLP
ncbi:MAG: hypothetical protein RL117_938 [Verrucomicrobiota bacterium]|jgi:hypothetical protein